MNYSDVDGGRGNHHDTDWNQDMSDFDSDFSHSGGMNMCSLSLIPSPSISQVEDNFRLGYLAIELD